jgi:hypothetical protein
VTWYHTFKYWFVIVLFFLSKNIIGIATKMIHKKKIRLYLTNPYTCQLDYRLIRLVINVRACICTQGMHINFQNIDILLSLTQQECIETSKLYVRWKGFKYMCTYRHRTVQMKMRESWLIVFIESYRNAKRNKRKRLIYTLRREKKMIDWSWQFALLWFYYREKKRPSCHI